MKVLLSSLVVTGLVLVCIAQFLGGGNGLSAACGAGTTLLNISLIGLTWRWIMAKKLVALMIAIIVFKFALLVWILYAAAHSELIHLGWFALGLGMVIPSAIVTAFWKKPAGGNQR